MKKRTLAMMMAALMLSTALTGCKGKYAASSQDTAAASAEAGTDAASDTAKTGTPKDTLVCAIVEDMTSMDPQETNRATNWAVQRQMYNHLVHENPDGSVDPELATEWEWLDDLTLRMKLRDDVYFHNGVQFTAKDPEGENNLHQCIHL